MEQFRSRPKSDYLLVASWQDLYRLAEHWYSDMEFYKDEIRFLFQLVNQHYRQLLEDNELEKSKVMAKGLMELDRNTEKLSARIGEHQKHLESLFDHPFVNHEMEFRNDHADLEDELVRFTVEFKKTKAEVFNLTEVALRSEKLKHLLS